MPSFFAKLLATRMLIRVMGGLGLLWLGYIMLSASFSGGGPKEVSLERLATRVEGFALAFPPRPIPPMPVQGANGPVTLNDIEGKIIITHFRPVNCGTRCDAALEALYEQTEAITGPQVSLVSITLSEKVSTLPVPVPSYADPQGLYRDYVGTGPMTVIYQPGWGEIGRDNGQTNWGSPAATRFLEALAIR
ncbi:MAG: hypothetical protein AAF723_07425 [Pseudomonadota bacterium]